VKLSNSELNPNADGTYPDRKLTAMYDYSAQRFRWAIAQKQSQGVTIYRDIDGEQFSSLDTDPTRYPSDKTPEMTLTGADLETLLAMAVADPKDAIALFSQLPPELKPELQAALKTLPADVRDGLKREAIALKESAKPAPYIPSNSSEGDAFAAKWCDRCNRNDLGAEIYCPILDHALTEPEPPEQWIYRADVPTCTEFERNHFVDATKMVEKPAQQVAA
jgi:hypothetical protein